MNWIGESGDRCRARLDSARNALLVGILVVASALAAGCLGGDRITSSVGHSVARTTTLDSKGGRASGPDLDARATLKAWASVDTVQAKLDHDRLLAVSGTQGDEAAQREFEALPLRRREAVVLALTPVHLVVRAEEVPASNARPEALAVSGSRAVRFFIDCYDAAGTKAFTWNHQVDWAWSGGRVVWGSFNPWGTTSQSIYNYDGVFSRYQTGLNYQMWHTFSQGQFSSAFRLRISFKGVDIGFAKTWKPWIDVYVDANGLYRWSCGASAG